MGPFVLVFLTYLCLLLLVLALVDTSVAVVVTVGFCLWLLGIYLLASSLERAEEPPEKE